MAPKPQPITATTRYAAVYGHPVKHSASPAMHNAAMAEMGLNWRYLAFDVDPADLRAAIAGARQMKFIGLNLTVPHKLLAIDMMDELDPSAETYGAVNTVLFEGRTQSGDWAPLRSCDPGEVRETRSRGFNTDAFGITRSLREDLGMKVHDTVLVLGAGGAARAAILRLAGDCVRELYLVNRTLAKAEQIGREIRARFPGIEVRLGYPANRVDLVLNATSLGLKPSDPLPYDPAQFSFKNCGAAYDMIYQPVETPFLKEAAGVGCRIANGLGMLLYQGAKALEIWAGVPAPVEVMRRALKEHIYGENKTA
ncbi:MAG TPA: shikimate dehydrogenase [Verrucomicrobiae bacterium]|nr:shikimate dehydrogenase [Verrucomicrobiae bacterium]